MGKARQIVFSGQRRGMPGMWQRRFARLPFTQLFVPEFCLAIIPRIPVFGPCDLGFDQKIVRTADHEQMFDAVAPYDHELTLAVDPKSINETKPHWARPAVAR
jgi:hypothetical protein